MDAMREDLVPVEVVVDLWNISRSRLQRMIKRGVIRPHPSSIHLPSERWLFRMTDVSSLRRVQYKETNASAAMMEAQQACMETRALRQEVDNLRKALGVDMPTLPTSRDDVVSLLLRAEDALRDLPTQDVVELLDWAKNLYAITEAHLAAITFHTEQKAPWRAFLSLGRHLMSGENPMVTRYDANLQGVYQILAASVRHVRQVAYFHIRVLHGKKYADKILPEARGCPHEDVIAMSFQGMENVGQALAPYPVNPGPSSPKKKKPAAPARSPGSGG
jgi:hypothetical protein